MAVDLRAHGEPLGHRRTRQAPPPVTLKGIPSSCATAQQASALRTVVRAHHPQRHLACCFPLCETVNRDWKAMPDVVRPPLGLGREAVGGVPLSDARMRCFTTGWSTAEDASP